MSKPIEQIVRWIPVDLELPRHNGFYLIATRDCRDEDTGISYYDKQTGFECEEEVTHWAAPLLGPTLCEASPVDELVKALAQAMRQWKMYADKAEEDDDIEVADHAEGRIFRWMKELLAKYGGSK